MSQQPPKKRARKVALGEEPMTAGVSGAPMGDEDGYLVIALATMVVVIVGLTVAMIVLAAT